MFTNPSDNVGGAVPPPNSPAIVPPIPVGALIFLPAPKASPANLFVSASCVFNPARSVVFFTISPNRVSSVLPPDIKASDSPSISVFSFDI